jgi:hypothetical protein
MCFDIGKFETPMRRYGCGHMGEVVVMWARSLAWRANGKLEHIGILKPKTPKEG